MSVLEGIGVVVFLIVFGFITYKICKSTDKHGKETAPCRFCREPVQKAATVCPHCGRENPLTFWQRYL